ncbi:hypothetical protein AB0L14_38595 [Streptomyces sp. NPDC052727]|uniref:hypothetical protein n=1 Tax=Streptomyces sp. NPDC052727 TaxID=3154854 RepID=UPI0034229D88
MLVGILVRLRLPSRPEDASWLSAEEAATLTRAAAEPAPSQPASVSTVTAALPNPPVLLSAALTSAEYTGRDNCTGARGIPAAARPGFLKAVSIGQQVESPTP